jgi:DNA-binding MarR family transcriptional regulator
MNQLEKEILYWLRESKKEKVRVGELVGRLNKDQNKIVFALGVLADNNLVEIEHTPSGRTINRAWITEDGRKQFKESTKIVSKESVKDTIFDLKERISLLELAFENMQQNPSEDNKKSFIDKLDSFQSAANGVAPWVKAGLDLFFKS